MCRPWTSCSVDWSCLILSGTRGDGAPPGGPNGRQKLAPHCGLPGSEQVTAALCHLTRRSSAGGVCGHDCLCFSANLDKQTAGGSTALHYCCLTDNSECLKLLLRGKATVSISKSSSWVKLQPNSIQISAHLTSVCLLIIFKSFNSSDIWCKSVETAAVCAAEPSG